jgi:hypothetical protein
MRNGTDSYVCFYASWLTWPGAVSRLGGTLLATSTDGKAWTKPVLGRVMLGNSSANNVLLAQREGCEGNLGVLRDEGENNPGQLFKVTMKVESRCCS